MKGSKIGSTRSVKQCRQKRRKEYCRHPFERRRDCAAMKPYKSYSENNLFSLEYVIRP